MFYLRQQKTIQIMSYFEKEPKKKDENGSASKNVSVFRILHYKQKKKLSNNSNVLNCEMEDVK